MWALSIHRTIINSVTVLHYQRSTFSSKALASKIFWLRAWSRSDENNADRLLLLQLLACYVVSPFLNFLL